MTDAAPTEREPRPSVAETMQRVKAQLKLHAGHGPWGDNDGSLVATLRANGVNPTDFLESLDSWGYSIVIREAAGAATETGGLDPKRLASAMRAAEPYMRSYGGDECDCPPDEDGTRNRCYGHDRRDEQAASIAFHYARLASGADREDTARLRSPSVGEDTPE